MAKLSKHSIKKLIPSKLEDFRSTLSQSSRFKKKLYDATRHGELKSLGNDSQAIVDVVKKRSSDIRKGTYGSGKRAADLREIMKDPNISQTDKKKIQGVLQTLSEGHKIIKEQAVKKETPKAKPSAPRRIEDINTRAGVTRDRTGILSRDKSRSSIFSFGSKGDNRAASSPINSPTTGLNRNAPYNPNTGSGLGLGNRSSNTPGTGLSSPRPSSGMMKRPKLFK